MFVMEITTHDPDAGNEVRTVLNKAGLEFYEEGEKHITLRTPHPYPPAMLEELKKIGGIQIGGTHIQRPKV